MKKAHGAAEDVVTRSIRMLADHGYLETTVEQLAQTAGISRATFFRKYGSKEDVVFADHSATLDRLELLLERPALPPQSGLVEGAQLVFRHALEDPGRAVARHDLLQRVESLRDREIAMSSRYEHVFRAFLRRALPESPDREVTAVALASATVAVHNSFLRMWLRDPLPSAGERLGGWLSDRIAWLCAVFGVAPDDTVRQVAADVTGPPVAATLDREDPAALGQGATRNEGATWGASATRGEGAAPIVVVLPEGADPADAAQRVACSVYRALRGQPRPGPGSETRAIP